MFTKLKENIIELIFPSHCVFCDKIGSFLCEKCRGKIIKIKDQVCPGCNSISKKGKYCSRCKRKNSLTGVVSFGYFKDPILKELIHAYKYDRVSALSGVLAEFFLDVLERESISFDMVFFVPLSKRREAWRGFNQAELIAEEVACHFGIPLGVIKKTKETKTQVGLAKKEREKNLRNVFCLIDPIGLVGKRVLLIDDVVTTAATLNECAKILKQNGAKVVYGAVLAKE